MRAHKQAVSTRRPAPAAGIAQQRTGAVLRPAGRQSALLGAPDLLALQRAMGNRATARWLNQGLRQAGQPVSAPGCAGQIQRVMNMESLRKAFSALGADAAVSSMPSFEYGADLNKRIAAAKTAKERQRIITEVQQAYGIDSDREGMTYDPTIQEDEAVTSSGRPAQIGPGLFDLSTGPLAHLRMALTLNHENLHRQQYKRIGETDIAYAPNADQEQAQQIRLAARKEQMLREVMAYESELVVIQQFRDTFYQDDEPPELVEQALEAFAQQAQEERDAHLQQLGAEEQELFQQGKYAELLTRIRQPVPDEAVRLAAPEHYWEDFIDATAMLYRLKDMAARWRPNTMMRRKWHLINQALERRFYESSMGHWWLVRTPEDMSTLDIRAEVNRMLKEDSLVPPFDFWGRVRKNDWAPTSMTIP